MDMIYLKSFISWLSFHIFYESIACYFLKAKQSESELIDMDELKTPVASRPSSSRLSSAKSRFPQVSIYLSTKRLI